MIRLVVGSRYKSYPLNHNHHGLLSSTSFNSTDRNGIRHSFSTTKKKVSNNSLKNDKLNITPPLSLESINPTLLSPTKNKSSQLLSLSLSKQLVKKNTTTTTKKDEKEKQQVIQEKEEDEEDERVEEEEEEEIDIEERIVEIEDHHQNEIDIDLDPKTLNITPAMKQYYHFKSKYPTHILLFRIGDFYEMFNEDAITVSTLLHITLTNRGIKNTKNEIPMCGFPHHSADTYIEKLIRLGKTVAVCDQLETPQTKSKGSKVVKRDVVRVVTPGTVYEDRFLQPFQNNYLLSLYPTNTTSSSSTKSKSSIVSSTLSSFESNQPFILSWLDLSTGQFYLSDTTYDSLSGELARISPSEILLPKSLINNENIQKIIKSYHVTIEDTSNYSIYNTRSMFKEAYNIDSDLQEIQESFPSFTMDQLGVAGSILNYIYNTQLGRIPHIDQLEKYSFQQSMFIDFSTRNSLELSKTFQNLRKGSLLDTIDKTLSSSGSRLLNYRLQSPSLSKKEINSRLNLVDYFYKHSNQTMIKDIRKLVSKCYDLERCLQRVYIGKAGPRDLASIGSTLASLTFMKSMVLESIDKSLEGSKDLIKLVKSLADFEPLLDDLSNALVDSPPINTVEGGFIQPSYSKDLQQFINLGENGKELIMAIQKKYKTLTGIPTLKVKHNQVIGHFFEIISNYRSKIPSNFIHVQTLINHMRFKSNDLIELEEKINRAKTQGIDVELKIFQQLCDQIKEYGEKIKSASQILGIIDISSSFAMISKDRNYIRPIITDEPILNIIGGRHPTVEVSQMEKIGSIKSFVTNDCYLGDKKDSLLWLITGPNMGGKSTFLRQNALIAIMAQIGCFVPADKAEIGIVDSIFSRVGSSDDLANDRSTFMVEMVETASILKKATSKSLVVMDEVGRGTSTLDGLSIAQSVIEHLYHNIQCRTLFATHHHELTSLSKNMKKIKCHALAVKEIDDELLFTHKIMPGISNKSYGIFCAKMAGVPQSVISRSQQILLELENKQKN